MIVKDEFKFLILYSNISKEVAVIGMINKIELWNPSVIKSIDDEAEGLEKINFDDLANEINF